MKNNMNGNFKSVSTCLAIVLIAAGDFAGAAFAETAGHRPMRFDRISMSDGLSQSTVTVVKQDSTGFLWLGTESGLNRYDGYKFHHYKRDPGNPGALGDDFIWDIAEDRDGSLWVATNSGGLARWDSDRDSFTTFRHSEQDPDSIASDSVRTVLDAGYGGVWVGTRGHGLDRLDTLTGKAEHFRSDAENPASIAGDSVFALLRDTRGTIWIGTDSGLSRFEPITQKFTNYRHDPDDPRSLSDNRVRALYEDAAGSIWVGTRRGGLNVLKPDDSVFTRYQHDPDVPGSLSNNGIRAILEDDAGRMWVGTGAGLNLFDRANKSFHRYLNDRADPGSLSDGYVMSIFQDRSGVLWVGTRSGGLNKWNPRSWGFGHVSPDQLSDGNVTSFAEDSAERLWVGTFGGGVNRIDRTTGEIRQFRNDPDDITSLSDNRIMSLLLNRDGDLWLGTMVGGLNRMNTDTGTVQRFLHDPDNPGTLSANGIMALFEDRQGNLWIGTFGGGVNVLPHGSDAIQRLPYNTGDSTGMSGAKATAFAQDSAGRMWIGTDSGGLNVFDPTTGRFHHFRNDLSDPDSLSADTVYALHIDIKGAIWVGTQGGGMDRVVGRFESLDEVRFRSVTRGGSKVGNDVVYGIESDTDGHLWISTNYGLTHYVPTTGAIRNFHRSHGLQDEEFNFGSHYRSGRGELFFGGANGFNSFFPSVLEINNKAPKVILTQILLLNQPLETAVPHWRLPNLSLGYQDDVISFEFSALDFTAPAENRYAYKLEGFDPDWIQADSVRRVTYTNLSGGEYVFRVKAANSDGVWQEQDTAIAFHADPPPWQTWWAYLSYAAMLISLMVGVWFAQRVKLLREEEYSRRLEQDVQERTRELAERNSELKCLNTRFLEASLTDPLTGLRNRRYVFEEVVKDIDIIRRRYLDAAPISEEPAKSDFVFMMIDLDNFKPINDTCGHAAGDKMLLQVRDLLMDVCRQSDVVIRWGGDEFLVIGRYSERAQGEALAERIRSRMADKVFSIGAGQAARTTCSIGIAAYPFVRTHPDMLEWEQLLSLADAAMYRAKETRNAWVSYVSTESSATVVNPFYAFRDQTDVMVEQGMLEIHESREVDQMAAAG